MMTKKTRREAGFFNQNLSAFLPTPTVSGFSVVLATFLPRLAMSGFFTVLAAFLEAFFAKLLELVNLIFREHRLHLLMMPVLHFLHLGSQSGNIINRPHNVRLNSVITLQRV